MERCEDHGDDLSLIKCSVISEQVSSYRASKGDTNVIGCDTRIGERSDMNRAGWASASPKELEAIGRRAERKANRDTY